MLRLVTTPNMSSRIRTLRPLRELTTLRRAGVNTAALHFQQLELKVCTPTVFSASERRRKGKVKEQKYSQN